MDWIPELWKAVLDLTLCVFSTPYNHCPSCLYPLLLYNIHRSFTHRNPGLETGDLVKGPFSRGELSQIPNSKLSYSSFYKVNLLRRRGNSLWLTVQLDSNSFCTIF